MSIYKDMLAAGVEIDNHETDLYAKVTPESERIVAAYEYSHIVTRFRSAIDGSYWFDIPFAYTPAWPDPTEKYYD